MFHDFMIVKARGEVGGDLTNLNTDPPKQHKPQTNVKFLNPGIAKSKNSWNIFPPFA